MQYLQASSASVRSRSGRESSQSRIVSLNFPLENTHRDHGFPLPGRNRQQSCPGRGDSDPDPVPPSLAQHCEGTERAQTSRGDSLASEGRHGIHLREELCGWCCNATKAPAVLLSQFRAGMCLSLPSIRAEPAELCPTARSPWLCCAGSAASVDEKSSWAGPGELG